MKFIKLLSLHIFLTCFISVCNAQDNLEFLGAVELEDASVITYRLIFSELNGSIKGYSITDLHGEHETKNVISGFYDKDTKEFNFKEEDIIYTKSPITQDDFCFINFTGKLKLLKQKSKLSGDFKGVFKDGTKCVNGKIHLAGTDGIYRRMNKLNRKISKVKRIDDATKERINPVKILDSLRMNTLKEGENTSVFWKSDIFKMEIWDAGKEDGDMVSIFINGKKVLNRHVISHKKRIIEYKLTNKKTTVVLKAENMGKIAPNTAKVELYDGSSEIGLYTNLKMDKTTQLTIIKK